jgi:endonuclease/exonuclease/phosphatase family metal-dependent hydrolase/tetratricopeptide (TPR) repeat protein
MKKFQTGLMAFFFMVLLTNLSQALIAANRDPVKQALFRDVGAAIVNARDEGISEFAPKHFAKALEYYEAAEKNYDDGERLDKIRRRIGAALDEINRAKAATEISRVALADLLAVRREASLKGTYIDLKPNEYDAAERKYSETIAKAENGDIKSAQKRANDAIKLYRHMTVEALLDGPVRNAEQRLKQKKNLSKSERKQSQQALKTLKKSLDGAEKKAFNITAFDNKVVAELVGIAPETSPPSTSPSGAMGQLILQPDIPHPAVVATGGDKLEVFVVGKNSHLVQRSWNGRQWSGWNNLGGDLTSAATAVSPSPGRIDVFVRGKNGYLVQRTFNNGKWGGWNNLGGDLTSAPAAVSSSPGRIDVFIRGKNGHLVQRTFNNSKWSGWINLGGHLASAPAVTSPQEGHIELFIRGRNHHLVQRSFVNGAWSGWNNLGATISAAPSVVAFEPNNMHVFVRGVNGQLAQRAWNGSRWSGWQNLEGYLTAAPTAVAYAGSKLEVFGRDDNDQLTRRRLNNSTWGEWENLGGDLRGHLWKRLKILTHNVYAVDGQNCKSRGKAFGKHVANAQPAYDIVGVQEYYDSIDFDIWTCDPQPLKQAIRSTGRYKNKDNARLFYPRPLSQPNGGMGIFTLFPITKFAENAWDDGSAYYQAAEGYIFSRIKVPNTPITLDIYIVHVKSGKENNGDRRSNLKQLASAMRKHSSDSGNPVLVMGDFNIGGPPALDLDGSNGYRGNDGYHTQIMKILKNPIDIWNTTHPEKEGFTYDGVVNNLKESDHSYRIDYIFAVTDTEFTNSPYRVSVGKNSHVQIVNWTESCDGRNVSDHFGLEATLEIRDR